MAKTDIAGLLTGITSKPIDPMLGLSPQQRRMANVQQGSQAAAQGFGRMLGADIRPTEQKVQEALSKLNPDDPEQQKQILDIVGRFSPERVTALKAAFDKRNEELFAPGTRSEQRRAAFTEYVRETYGEKFAKLAQQGVLTPDNLDDFIVGQDATMLKGTTFTVEDSQGNAYTMIPTMNNKTGLVENKYSPITPGAPAVPDGDVVITGGEFAQTPGEAIKTKAQEKAELDYQGKRVEVVAALPEVLAKVDMVRRSMDLLKTVPTGGPINLVQTGLENFFGTKSADKAELQLTLGLQLFQALKPFFGGLISNQEAERVKAIYAGLEKGSAANEGILRQLEEQLLKTARIAQLYRNAESFDVFEASLPIIGGPDLTGKTSGTEETGDDDIVEIDFNNLPTSTSSNKR